MSLNSIQTDHEYFRRIPTLIWILAFCVLAFSIPASALAQQLEKKITTIFLVRHAEKDTIPADDPHLSTQGRERAESLAYMLEKSGISSIVTTELQRTRETASPLATLLHVTPTIIPIIRDRENPRKVSPQFYTALVKHIREHAGSTILVVGHSNTIPDLIRLLGGPENVKIDEKEFNHLFIMNLQGEITLTTLDLRYGK